MQKITPFLWFNGNAEQAVKFYLSVFKDAKILDTARYPEGSPGEPGSVMTIKFRLLGQEFIALNGGSDFKFNPAISFVVNCKTQKEIDYYWKKLTAGGKEVQCGWLEDKFGVSWQVTPDDWEEFYDDDDPERASRVMQAMMQMVKLDIKKLKAAYDGKGTKKKTKKRA